MRKQHPTSTEQKVSKKNRCQAGCKSIESRRCGEGAFISWGHIAVCKSRHHATKFLIDKMQRNLLKTLCQKLICCAFLKLK
jgi:hypothetical protein